MLYAFEINSFAPTFFIPQWSMVLLSELALEISVEDVVDASASLTALSTRDCISASVGPQDTKSSNKIKEIF